MKGSASGITFDWRTPSWEYLVLLTEVVPIYLLAVTHFQTAASPGAKMYDGS